MMPVLYALRPSGPEITRHALLHRLRQRGIQVVTLPAGHYILSQHRPIVDGVVAAINADLRGLVADQCPGYDMVLDVLFRPIPGPTDGGAS